jgi:hypothetical protein
VVVQKRYKAQTNFTASDFRFTDDGFPREIELFRVNDARLPHKPSPTLDPGAVSNRVDQEGNELQGATVVPFNPVCASEITSLTRSVLVLGTVPRPRSLCCTPVVTWARVCSAFPVRLPQHTLCSPTPARRRSRR